MTEKTEKRAKLFMNGHSQAVRLPKEFRFVGTEVRIRRSGDGVLLEPIGLQVGAKDLERVRDVIKTLEPLEPEFAAMVDQAMRKLEGGVAD
jgi:virulence-associated protein VagC